MNASIDDQDAALRAEALDEIEWMLLEHAFDVPAMRRRDVQWLLRNIGIRNRDNPHLNEVTRLLLSAAREAN